MEALAEFIVAIALSLATGPVVSAIINRAVSTPACPEGLGQEDWNELTSRSTGGKYVGELERLIAIVSAAIPEYTVIGGWLAFKVAAKWETWNNIVKVPTELGTVDSVAWYKGRSALGSWILTRFLVGTAANVLLGLLAFFLGSHSWEAYRAIFN